MIGTVGLRVTLQRLCLAAGGHEVVNDTATQRSRLTGSVRRSG